VFYNYIRSWNIVFYCPASGPGTFVPAVVGHIGVDLVAGAVPRTSASDSPDRVIPTAQRMRVNEII